MTSQLYCGYTKIFKTYDEVIDCPEKLKLIYKIDFHDGVPIPKKYHYGMFKREDFKNGDIVFVLGPEYPDRFYENGKFLILDAKEYDLRYF